MAFWANEFVFFTLDHLPPVRTPDSKAAEDFTRRLKEHALLRAEREARDPSEPPTAEELEALDELTVALHNIDLKSRLASFNVDYSPEFLERLAQLFEENRYSAWQVPKCPYDSDPPEFCFPE